MFNLGWTELLLIGIVILFAFGPEDIPKLMYQMGKIARRFQYMRYALSGQFDDFMKQADEKAANPGPKPIISAEDETDADEMLIAALPDEHANYKDPADEPAEPKPSDSIAHRG